MGTGLDRVDGADYLSGNAGDDRRGGGDGVDLGAGGCETAIGIP